MTYNGTEFYEHEYITRELVALDYSVYPCSWENGCIENTKMIRFAILKVLSISAFKSCILVWILSVY